MTINNNVSKLACGVKSIGLKSLKQLVESLIPAALLLVCGMPSNLAAADPKTFSMEVHKLTANPGVEKEQSSTETSLATRLSSLQAQVPPPTSAMKTPYGVAVDQAGNIYVANLSGAVNIYNSSHKLINTITNGVSAPVAVCIGYYGTIYVANNGTSQITVYTSKLQLTKTISDPAMQSPLGMYVDGDGNIFVLDGQGTVHMYLDDGTPVGTTSLTGASAVGPIGNGYGVYVPNDIYIQNSGEAIRYGMFATGFLDGPTNATATGATQDPTTSFVYWTDEAQMTLSLASVGGNVTAVGMTTPGFGIAVDPARKRLFIAEPLINKVGIYNATTLASIGVIN